MNSVFGQFAFDRTPCLVLGCWHNCCRIGRNELPLLLLRSKSMRILFHWYFYPRCCCSSFLHPPNLQSHFLLNSGLVVLVACLCTDAFVRLLAYEISLISICTAFSLEGRAYRRTFAFGIMLVLSLISTSMFLLALSNCSSSAGSANSLGHTDVAISLNWLC